jgi:CO/xanthine dehydrogenase FAD-binding subunit
MLRNVKSYKRPTTVEEAVAEVQSNPNAVYLSGGAWIVAQGDPELQVIVDLQDVGLAEIESDAEGVRIGAMATLQDLIDHPGASVLADGILATAAGYTQSRSLREQGTLGGTLIVAGPADPLTTAMLVLKTDIRYADPVLHTAPFLSFVAYRDRLVKTRVLITEIHVTRPPARSAAAFEVVGRSPKDQPIVCAAAYIAVDEGLPQELRLAVGGGDAKPMRLHKTEHLLKGQLLTSERIERALAPALAGLQPHDDFRGSANYRRAMAKTLTRRAVLKAWDRARRG